MSPVVACLTLLLSTVALVRGHGTYRQFLPNRGEHINCDGQDWPAIGHMYPLPQGGSFPRNPFGLEFRQFRVMDEDPNSSFRPQYQTLCQRDSDGDGVSNGQEMGDADCDGVLDQNLNNERLGHPGFCEARRGRCGAGASYCPNSQGARQGSQFRDQFGGAQSQGTNFPQSQSSAFQSQFPNQQQAFPPSQQQFFQLTQQTQFFPQPPRQQMAFPQQPQQQFAQQQQQQRFPQQPQQLFPQQQQLVQPRQQQAQDQFFFPNPQTQGISPRRFEQGPVSTDPFQSQGVVPWWNWGF